MAYQIADQFMAWASVFFLIGLMVGCIIGIPVIIFKLIKHA